MLNIERIWHNGLDSQEAALNLNVLTGDEFDKLVVPEKMIGPTDWLVSVVLEIEEMTKRIWAIYSFLKIKQENKDYMKFLRFSFFLPTKETKNKNKNKIGSGESLHFVMKHYNSSRMLYYTFYTSWWD